MFVTGSTGFLGQHLCRALFKQCESVVCLTRDHVLCHPVMTASNSVVVHGDLSLPFLERVLAEYEIDTVFHLAAQVQVSVAQIDPTGSCEANIHGTWNVLEACRRQQTKRLVLASTDKVYGDGKVPYQEDQPLLPHGIYATTKAAAELIAESYRREYTMSLAITRCGNLYGPGHTNWSALIPDAIRSALTGQTLLLRSDGTMKRDFLFVENAISAYLLLADSEETGVFNLGTGHSFSVFDIIRHLRECGLDITTRPLAEGQLSPRHEIQEQCLDCSKAATRLNWRATSTLASGLERTIRWYKDQLSNDSILGTTNKHA